MDTIEYDFTDTPRLLRLAEQGDAAAMETLAGRYFTAQEFVQGDFHKDAHSWVAKREAYWLRRAMAAWQARAEQGDADAFMRMATMLQDGPLFNPQQELEWMHRAAELGHATACIALGDAYEMEGIDYRYPVYRSMQVEDTNRGKQVRLTFDYAEDGFNRNVGIEGFEICGPDNVWHKASVGTSGRQVTVRSDEVTDPVAVRYAFKSFSLGNLKANSGLPVVPFRTDNFPK